MFLQCSIRLGGILVFEAVALLLRKEAGLFCRKEAVHLLFLLLNCKKTIDQLHPKKNGEGVIM